MPLPIELKPTKKPLVIDLVRQANVDVSDWSNYKRGRDNPGANPRYCYEWAFVQPNSVVVLTIWYDLLSVNNGQIEWRFDGKKEERSRIRQARRQRMQAAIAHAYKSQLPVRVIVFDRSRNPVERKKTNPAVARHLDWATWTVAEYDHGTHKGILQRKPNASHYVDQFSLPSAAKPEKHQVIATVHDRNPAVRQSALARAEGKCQLCGSPGFVLPNGQVFLETHHVIPLADNGPDSEYNVVALCPNHHREAHYGRNSEDIQQRLLKVLRQE
jgi:hypothetical protein